MHELAISPDEEKYFRVFVDMKTSDQPPAQAAVLVR